MEWQDAKRMGHLVLATALFLPCGCQNPNGSGFFQPLGTNVRVPPPPTGSVGTANGYTSPSAMNRSHLPQAAPGLAVTDLRSVANPPQTNTFANRASYEKIQSVGYDQDASKLAAPSSQAPQTPIYSGPAPTIPVAAMTPADYANSTGSFRPRLRGMHASELVPTGKISLQPVGSSPWSTIGSGISQTTQGTHVLPHSVSPINRKVPEKIAERLTDQNDSLRWRNPTSVR